MIPDLGAALAIARTTFRHGLRGRLSLLGIFSLGGILALGNLFRGFEQNLALELRLVQEVGMTLVAVILLGSALFLASRGITDPAKAPAYRTLLSLPFDRETILLGHLLGTLSILLLQALVLALALVLTLRWRFGFWHFEMLVWSATLYLEAVILVLVTTFFGMLGSSLFAFLAGGGWMLIAHSEQTLRHLAERSGNILLETLGRVLVASLPALRGMAIRTEVVRRLSLPWSELSWAVVHSVAYCLVVFWITCQVFRRREV